MVSRDGLPSPKEMAILDQLMPGRELYGLEMVKASKGMLKRGTIYVLLDRLEDAKFIASRLEDKPDNLSGMPRRLYRITGLGQRAYAAFHRARAAFTGAWVPA